MAQETTARKLRNGRPLHLAAAVAVGTGLAAGSMAAAQDQQQGNGAPQQQANGPQTQSPFWDDQPAGQAQHPAPQAHHPYHRPRDQEGFSQRFPVDLTAQVAPAHERYVALKWSYQTAQRQLRNRISLLQRQHEESEEYRDLQRQRTQVQAQLQQAEQQALEPLLDDPEYNAILELQGDIERQIRQAHQSPEPDLGRIRGMAELAMSYAQRRRELEANYLDASDRVEEARQQLRDINRQQAEMEHDYQRFVRDDEHLAMLREQIGQLRVAYLAAGAYYDTAVRAANIATDFAYYNAFTQGGGVSNPYLTGRYAAPYPYIYPHGHWTGGLIISGPGLVVGRGSVPPVIRHQLTAPARGNVIQGGPGNTMTPATVGTTVPRPQSGAGDRQRTRD